MKFMTVLCIFVIRNVDVIQGYTHWMVTESGLIQPRVGAPFELARPYDLLAFLNQENYWDDVTNIYNELIKRQTLIDELWNGVDKNTDVGSLVLLDKHCIRAGHLKHLDWYISFFEDGSSRNIPEQEYQLVNTFHGRATDIPDCKKISSLIFSMSAFDHLEGVINRENLTISPELYLPEKISPIMTVDQFAHWLSGVLSKNSSSWLHYNLASLYWRVRGNAPKAMECSRRAVHYAPRDYKDIALLNMGTILHRSKRTEDAVIVLNAAIDHYPNFYLSYFQLGNAYAVLCDFNSSNINLDECLKLNPNFEVAVKHKHAALCLTNIWEKLIVLRIVLNKLREELLVYSQKEAQLLKSQSLFLKAVQHNTQEEHDYRNVATNCEKMSELTGLDIKGLKLKSDKNSIIKYFLEGPIYTDLWSDKTSLDAIESAYSLQRLLRHIEKHSNMASDIIVQSDLLKAAEEKALKDPNVTPSPDLSKSHIEIKFEGKSNVKKTNIEIEDDMKEFETGPLLFPPTMKVNRNTEDFDRNSEWPSKKFCKETVPNFPEAVDAIFPMFVAFENKGIHLGTLLTMKLGVPASVEYELPWHPPTCPADKQAAGLTMKKSQKNPLGEVVKTDYLRKKLLEYVANGNVEIVKHMADAEIGQRIYAATKKGLAPNWLLYTLSSLYWRVRGNNANALHCLYTASKTVPPRHKDLVLSSLASVCLEMGHFDEALVAAEEAFRIGVYEPATNFVLAELNMLKKHHITHMFHLKQVVRVDREFYDGLAKNLLYSWACILKSINELAEIDFSDKEVCSQVEASFNMACEKDEKNCHSISEKCFNSKGKVDTSTIVHLLEIKNEIIHKSQMRSMDERFFVNIFDPFVDNMPEDRSNLLDHQHNFNSMMMTIRRKLKGCGPRGCDDLQAEDLALKEEDCTSQHMQLGYWLHIVTLKQPFTETSTKLPEEIAAIAPSNKKIPECRVIGDYSRDFFLDRVMNVDTNGWESIINLMHQFAEIFNFFDYVTLGAKIAKYVETNPRSWLAALAAGWWCGTGGRGVCAVRCLCAALALAPPQHTPHVLRASVALLHSQSKHLDAKDVAYLSFYLSPKSKIEAFLVAVTHTCLGEYEQAVWMYRYALTFDEKFLPAKACLHATMCLMFYGEKKGPKAEERS